MTETKENVSDFMVDASTKVKRDLRDPIQPDYNTLIGEQATAWDALQEFTRSGEQMFCFEGYAGVGKAQPLDSQIFTPNGWVNMGDINIGDEVFTEFGKPTKVNGVFPQGLKDIYEVTFYDGTSTLCCDEHLWKVADEKIRSRFRTKKSKQKKYSWVTQEEQKEYEWEVKPLKDFKDNIVGRGGRNEYCIPYCNPIDLPTKDLPIDPYVLGILLGEGSTTTDNITFTTIDNTIVENVRELLSDKFMVSQLPSDPICYNIGSNMLTENGAKLKGSGFALKLKEIDGIYGCKSYQKFIHDDYMLGSIQQRLGLLRGLMDTDGSINKKGLFNFGSTSEKMCKQVLELVKSLGGCPSPIRPKFLDGYKTYYRFNFKLSNFKPFTLQRKLDRIQPNKLKHNYIVDVVYVGKQEAQCIQVEDVNRTYITDGYNVTHNTYVMNMFIEDMIFNHDAHICACAPTHKAKSVLIQMAEFKSENLQYNTIHALLKLKEIVNAKGEQMFVKDRNIKTNISDYNYIAIDEASMLDDLLFSYLLEECDRHPEIKIIFIGDQKQLPPVKHTCSAPMDAKRREKHEIGHVLLKQIVRQKGTNPIIKLSKELRELNWNPKREITEEGHGVIIVPRKEYKNVLNKLFTSGQYEKDPNYCRVVAWTNLTVNSFNDQIRKMIYKQNIVDDVSVMREGGSSDTEIKDELQDKYPYWDGGKMNLPKYVVGDKLIADKPIFHPMCSKTIIFHTNEEMIITDLEQDYREGLGEMYLCYVARVKNLYTGKMEEIEMVHETCEPQFEKHLEKLKKSALAVNPKNNSKRIEKWRFYYNLLQRFAQLKYAPCLTTYKSQGSTYENIVIMAPDILKNPKKNERFQHLYVGVTRATKRAIILI